MNYKFNSYFLIFHLFIVSLTSSSCLRRKCRDTSATNSAFFTFGLSDNSKCIYSKVAFYNSKGSINNSSVSKVDLFINQSYIGEITQIYPNGIGNCTATGTVSYLFTNGHSVDWEAKYTLLNGNIFYTNGTVSPDSSLTCMSQDVYK